MAMVGFAPSWLLLWDRGRQLTVSVGWRGSGVCLAGTLGTLGNAEPIRLGKGW
jgi:hypothetical protein